MIAEGVRPPGAGGEGGGLGAREKPPQIQNHWWEMMDSLPGQVLRPLRDATKSNLTPTHRRIRRSHARERLQEYVRDLSEWMQSVDAMMRRHGEPSVDKLDGAQAEAFHASLTDSERKALAKCQRVRAAIAYGHMTLNWLEWELADGR